MFTIAGTPWLPLPDPIPCRSEPARDELEHTSECQAFSIIVDLHREQARSYTFSFANFSGLHSFYRDDVPLCFPPLIRMLRNEC